MNITPARLAEADLPACHVLFVRADHIAWRDGVALDNWIMKKALP